MNLFCCTCQLLLQASIHQFVNRMVTAHKGVQSLQPEPVQKVTNMRHSIVRYHGYCMPGAPPFVASITMAVGCCALAVGASYPFVLRR